ncbi:MAG: hypothetical protein AB1724_03825 [Thermodesulfobacteriota bacterium]
MRERLFLSLRSGLWLLLFLSLLAGTGWALPGGVSIQKTFLGKPSDDWQIFSDSIAFSPDMNHVAVAVITREGMRVAIDDKMGETYSRIAKGYPVFSPSRNRAAYIAARGNQHFVVIDGKESAAYDSVCCLRFSPDGSYTAYIVQDKDKQHLVLNGNRMKAYDMIDIVFGPVFSPDSKKIVYVAKNNAENNVRLIVNGQESSPCDAITEILFSPDGKTVAYIATRGKKQFVIRGAREEGPYDKAEGLTWSPDSKKLAYIAIRNDEFLVVHNGRVIPVGSCSPQTVFYEGGLFATIIPQITQPSFSPDSSLLAFTRMEQGKYQVVIGSKTGPPFNLVTSVVFSPDSKHYAYTGVSEKTAGATMQMVHNETSGQAYDFIDQPTFSPDSGHLAYRIGQNGLWAMVLDEKPQKFYDSVGPPYFSPDSRILAYQAMSGNKAVMVVNGQEQSYPVEFQENEGISPKISRPCFSPDSRHLAYLVKPKLLQCQLVINGNIVETFDFVVSQEIDPPIVFNRENKTRILGAFLEGDRFKFFWYDIAINGQNK